jgi:predicted metal-dependent hydrolase
MRTSVIALMIIFILAIIAIIKLEKHEVKYVKSSIDNKDYLVRDLADKQQAANLLSQVHMNIMQLTDHLYRNRDKYTKFKEPIERIKEKINDTVINESSEDSSYTSYSVNKGDQIVFCLRSKSDGHLHDVNLVMYVAIHELAHVGCKSFGHTDEFKQIFAFLIMVATELGIYTRINFKQDPVEYCGLVISEHI